MKLNRKVRKGERNDKMACESKSKAFLNTKHVNERTHFDLCFNGCKIGWVSIIALDNWNHNEGISKLGKLKGLASFSVQ